MAAGEEPSVLVVDDDPHTLKLIKHHLSGAGLCVRTASTGSDGLEQLRQSPVDLILCDVMMPHMSGMAFRERVLADETISGTPFIFLTVRGGVNDQLAGLAAGAEEYLIKPFDPGVLIARVQAVLLRRHALATEQAAVEGLKLELRQRQRAEAHLADVRQQEIEIAARIQQMLLLGAPPDDVHGVHVAAMTIPSELVDGDFFEFFRHGRRCMDIIVGDVMGKGVPAALVGAATKIEFLRALAHLTESENDNTPPTPEQIVMAVHHRLTPRLIELESFVTLCYGRIDLEAMRIDLVDCGHTKTILLNRRTRQWKMLASHNVPLGVAMWEVYRQFTEPLTEGDLLLFYSDGVTEAKNVDGDMFGVERLLETIGRCSHLEPDEIIETIRAAVAAFSGSDAFGDDLTCLAVDIQPVATAAAHTYETLEFTSHPADLRRLRQFTRDACSHTAADASAVAAVEDAVAAVAVHIADAAYEQKTDRRIRAEFTAGNDRIEMDLLHWGRILDETAEVIDHQAMDHVQCVTDSDGAHRIRLVKSISPATVR